MDYAILANYERSDKEEHDYYEWNIDCTGGSCKLSAADLALLDMPVSWCPVNNCTHNKFGECACNHECPVEFEEF